MKRVDEKRLGERLRLRGIGRACVLMGDGRGRRLWREVVSDCKDEEGEGRRLILRTSMSAGVTYCVPATHWKFEIVGLGGMRASGLNSLSNDFGLRRMN